MPFSPCDPAVAGSCQDESSLNFLRHVFGPVIDRLTQGIDPGSVADAHILAEMLKFFNSGVLVIGAIVASYTAVMGVINTANDGEVMGKNWSATATPLRIVAGAGVLLPTTSGYNFIQLITLMIALWSVGFANGIYKAGVAMGILSPQGIVAGAYEAGTTYGFRDFASSYVVSAYCMRAAENIYFNPSAQPAAAARPMIRWTSTNDQYRTMGRETFTVRAVDTNGFTNLGGSWGAAGTPLCGTYTTQFPTPTGSSDPLISELDALDSQISMVKWNQLWQLRQKLDQWVATWPASLEQSGWHTITPDRFNQIVKETETAVAQQLAAQSTSAVSTALTNLVNSVTKPGWAEAAGWFQRVGMLRQRMKAVLERPIAVASPPVLTGLADDARRARLLAAVESAPQQVLQRAANTWAPPGGRRISPSDLTTSLPTDPTSSFSPSAISEELDRKTATFLGGWMESLVELATGANSTGAETALCRTDTSSLNPAPALGGSVMRMKCVGDMLTVLYGSIWTFDNVVKSTVTALRVTAGVASAAKVVGSGLDLDKATTPLWDWVIQVFSPGLAEVMKYLRPVAFYFGVLLPSMPYIIFMIVVVGWVLSLLQAMLATPLWALMHMRPDRTFIGSEKQGYLLLLGLFARPALAIIGLFAALLVVDPVIDYAARGFFAMRGAIVASTGALGFLAEFVSFLWWLTVFGIMLLPLMYMTFGLAQALPDRVLGWLNAGTPDLGESNASSKVLAGLAATGSLPGSVMGRRGGGGQGQIGGPGQPRQLSGPDTAPEGDTGGNRGPGGGGRGGAPGARKGQPQLLTAGHQGVGPSDTRDDIAPAGPGSSSTTTGDGKARAGAGNDGGAPLPGGQGAVARTDRPGSRARPSGAFGRYDAIGTAPPVASQDADRVPGLYRSAPGGMASSSSRGKGARPSAAPAVLSASAGAGASTLREKQAEADAQRGASGDASGAAPQSPSAGGDVQQRARPTRREVEAAAAAEQGPGGSNIEQRPAGTHKNLSSAGSAGRSGAAPLASGNAANPAGTRAAAERERAAELESAREAAERDSNADQTAAPSERPAPHVFERPNSGDDVINQGPGVRQYRDE